MPAPTSALRELPHSTADDIAFLSIPDLAEGYRNGTFSPVDVTELLLERIRVLDPHLRSYVHVAEESARRAAVVATEELAMGFDRGPLHGVPIAIKDIFFDSELPTTAGMVATPLSWRTNDATAIRRLRAAGAVILGTTVTTEGVHAAYRPGVIAPRNPWNAEFWSGASSSGPGVAVAAGLCFAALGSDTGASIRFPSAANGVTGIKPTWGRVSRRGVAPLAPSLDHIGTMARSAVDADLVLAAIEGFDPADRTSLRTINSRAADGGQIGGLRVGVVPSLLAALPADVASAISATEHLLAESGARIVATELPDTDIAVRAWETITACEALAGHSETFPRRATEYGAELASLLRVGETKTTGELLEAEHYRSALKLEMADLFSEVDVLLCPAFPGRIPTVGEWDDTAGDHTGAVLRPTAPFNLAGTPTVTFPIGFDARSLPVGVQLCGAAGTEGRVAALVGTLQKRTATHRVRPTDLRKPVPQQNTESFER